MLPIKVKARKAYKTLLIFKKSSLYFKKGFSLIEILVALTLMAFVMYTLVTGAIFMRDPIGETVGDLERAIRFCVDESALRGSMVRMKIEMDEDPQVYSVEFGPKEGLILPNFQEYDQTLVKSIREREQIEKEVKKIDQQFSPIPEFNKGPKELGFDVYIYGVSTGLRSRTLMSDGKAYIYFYPSGEKDSAFILVGDKKEISTLVLSPFTDIIRKKYYKLSENQQEDEDALLDRVKDIHNTQYKEKP